MGKRSIDEQEGRSLFGSNPMGYSEIRPDYPEAFFDDLRECGALGVGTRILDVGAGSGLASIQLLRHGASFITMLEPDVRFSSLLSAIKTGTNVVTSTLEEAALEPGAFDLVVVATAFHWLDPERRVSLLAKMLHKGGYVALMWNVFGDEDKQDDFHEATDSILSGLGDSPSGAPGERPFALRRTDREEEFLDAGLFEQAGYRELKWLLQLSSLEMIKLYETFSPIQKIAKSERQQILAKLGQVADSAFGGVVNRNMTSVLYLFRKR